MPWVGRKSSSNQFHRSVNFHAVRQSSTNVVAYDSQSFMTDFRPRSLRKAGRIVRRLLVSLLV